MDPQTDTSPISGAPLLELDTVSKHYGAVTALDSVSLHVNAGEVVALAGDNGAGKSTLIKLISGIIRPDSGAIRVDGKDADIHGPNDSSALGIQTVYQDLALCDNLDTVTNLFLGHELRAPWYLGGRLDRPTMESRARTVLTDLNVKIRNYHAAVGSLSGGQRQSIAVCRSLLWNPKVVLLDEPTAALGVPQRKEVLEMIERIRDQGRGVILVSHDLADVLRVADRTVVLRLGRKVAEFDRTTITQERLVSAITGMQELMQEVETTP